MRYLTAKYKDGYQGKEPRKPESPADLAKLDGQWNDPRLSAAINVALASANNSLPHHSMGADGFPNNAVVSPILVENVDRHTPPQLRARDTNDKDGVQLG